MCGVILNASRKERARVLGVEYHLSFEQAKMLSMALKKVNIISNSRNCEKFRRHTSDKILDYSPLPTYTVLICE